MPNPTPNTSGLMAGGTSLSGDGTHSPRVTISLPADVKAEIDRRATEAGMGTAKYLRRIIEQHLTASA
mgnify:CR=1 FL=1